MVGSDNPVARMNIPTFHDGLLRSLAVERGEATIGIRRVDGPAFELKLEGVEALHAVDFRQGNIIYSLQIIQGRGPEGTDFKEALERLFPSPHTDAAAEYHERHADFLLGVLKRISTAEAAMVIIEASYGCDLVAVCHEARVVEVFG
jgi:hypothetical protein